MKNLIAILLLAGAFLPKAQANICGTDYQNFNPTTNGIDFVTVHSSETLKPCIVNMGLFLNYAANSLTYSKTLNADFPAGQKRRDRTVGMDLSAGMGITDRWDFGVNIPFVLGQTVQDEYYVSSFNHNGATEVKANTKYKLLGDDSKGIAAIVSLNKNLVSDNPFMGNNAGLTWNYELAADTMLGERWAVGVNVGYRDRDPGTPLSGIPFVPMNDQWIYSAAGSYLFASWDTKLILEIYGSKAAKKVELDTDRNLDSLEGLIGMKHDVSGNFAVHAGGATQLGSTLGGPDWRVYAGFNWAIGPLCGKKAIEALPAPTPTPAPTAEASAPITPDVYKLDVEMMFAWNSDQLDENHQSTIDEVLKEALAKGYERIVIEGHTDSLGVEIYNLDLSRRRAESVRKSIIERQKISPDKVFAEGFGQTQPIADNGNYQGRRQNRRVEIKIWRKNP